MEKFSLQIFPIYSINIRQEPLRSAKFRDAAGPKERRGFFVYRKKRGPFWKSTFTAWTAADARRELEQLLSRTGADITELLVIHGYRGGNALQDMVRLRLKHPRIASKMVSLNAGQTRILLQAKAK